MAFKETCRTLEKTQADEPIFVLVGRDRLAATTVRMWATLARFCGVNDEKITEALGCAERMDRWPAKKTPD